MPRQIPHQSHWFPNQIPHQNHHTNHTLFPHTTHQNTSEIRRQSNRKLPILTPQNIPPKTNAHTATFEPRTMVLESCRACEPMDGGTGNAHLLTSHITQQSTPVQGIQQPYKTHENEPTRSPLIAPIEQTNPRKNPPSYTPPRHPKHPPRLSASAPTFTPDIEPQSQPKPKPDIVRHPVVNKMEKQTKQQYNFPKGIHGAFLNKGKKGKKSNKKRNEKRKKQNTTQHKHQKKTNNKKKKKQMMRKDKLNQSDVDSWSASDYSQEEDIYDSDTPFMEDVSKLICKSTEDDLKRIITQYGNYCKRQ
eukprot:675260_1